MRSWAPQRPSTGRRVGEGETPAGGASAGSGGRAIVLAISGGSRKEASCRADDDALSAGAGARARGASDRAEPVRAQRKRSASSAATSSRGATVRAVGSPAAFVSPSRSDSSATSSSSSSSSTAAPCAAPSSGEVAAAS
eukprot:7387648-Prymnesium_polylepis.1